MIDLSYKKPEEKKEEELHPVVQGLFFVIISAFFTLVVLSAIAGEPLF